MNQKSYLEDLEAAVEHTACFQTRPAGLARSVRADVEKAYLLVPINELPKAFKAKDGGYNVPENEKSKIANVYIGDYRSADSMEEVALAYLAAAQQKREDDAKAREEAFREAERKEQQWRDREALWAAYNTLATFDRARFVGDQKSPLAKAIDEVLELRAKLVEAPTT